MYRFFSGLCQWYNLEAKLNVVAVRCGVVLYVEVHEYR